MKIALIYHRADYDGLMSAAVVQHFAHVHNHTVDRFGWDFGDPEPDINSEGYGLLVVVDLPFHVCPGWIGHSNFVWIDHHKSSIEKAHREFPEGLHTLAPGGFLVEDGTAACRLAHRFFSKNHFTHEPILLRMIGEYDVWDLSDPDVVALQYGLVATRGIRTDDEEIDRLISRYLLDDVEPLVTIGKHVQDWHRTLCNQVAAERLYFTMNCGVRFATLASAHARGSFWFGDQSLLPTEKFDALLAFRTDGHRAFISMYHADHAKHLDLSEIARKYGGGGHRGACGCEMTLEDFFKEFPVIS